MGHRRGTYVMGDCLLSCNTPCMHACMQLIPTYAHTHTHPPTLPPPPPPPPINNNSLFGRRRRPAHLRDYEVYAGADASSEEDEVSERRGGVV